MSRQTIQTADITANAVTQNGGGQGNADYTTTSTTFVDLDATNQAVTLTTVGGDVFADWFGVNTQSTATAVNDVFTLAKDGTNQGNSGNGLTGVTADNARNYPIGFVWRDAAPTSASHTYKVQWKCTSNTSTLYGTSWRTQFRVFELKR